MGGRVPRVLLDVGVQLVQCVFFLGGGGASLVSAVLGRLVGCLGPSRFCWHCQSLSSLVGCWLGIGLGCPVVCGLVTGPGAAFQFFQGVRPDGGAGPQGVAGCWGPAGLVCVFLGGGGGVLGQCCVGEACGVPRSVQILLALPVFVFSCWVLVGHRIGMSSCVWSGCQAWGGIFVLLGSPSWWGGGVPRVLLDIGVQLVCVCVLGWVLVEYRVGLFG